MSALQTLNSILDQLSGVNSRNAGSHATYMTQKLLDPKKWWQ